MPNIRVLCNDPQGTIEGFGINQQEEVVTWGDDDDHHRWEHDVVWVNGVNVHALIATNLENNPIFFDLNLQNNYAILVRNDAPEIIVAVELQDDHVMNVDINCNW